MKKENHTKINPIRIIILTLIFTSIGEFVILDYNRVEMDFENALSLFKQVRTYAGVKGKQLILKFEGDNIVVTHGESGKPFSSLTVPTLHNVNYDTTLGKDMIVYTGAGTSAHNLKEHGGDLTLKSWLGFTKHIAINCNGLPTEGRYPE